MSTRAAPTADEQPTGNRWAIPEEGAAASATVTVHPQRARGAHRFRDTTDEPPDSSAAPGGADLFGLLARDWARLTRSPTSEVAVTRWAGRHVVLHGLWRLDQVLERLDRGSRPEQDAVLHALLRENAESAPLAGRTVLQAMLPKLVRLTRSVRPNHCDGPDPDDRASSVVAAMWEAIVTWPDDRPGTGVAGRLALDTLNRVAPRERPTPSRPHSLYRRHVRLDEPSTLGVDDGSTPAGRQGPPADAHGRALARVGDPPLLLPGELNPDGDLESLAVWSVAAGVLHPEEAALLVGYHAADHGERGWLAAAHDVSEPALRKRVSRLAERLRARAQAELAG